MVKIVPKGIRPSVVIVREGRVLVMKSRYADGEYYVLPGGGIKGMESVKETALREAKEETGYDIRIVKLLCIHEWIDKRRGKNSFNVIFLGEIVGGEETHLNDPDLAKGDILGIEWKTLDELRRVVFHPRGILPLLEKGIETGFSGGAVCLEPEVTG